MGVLYAKVSGNWVPVPLALENPTSGEPPAGSSWVVNPAQAGARQDSATQARFGNVNEPSKRNGFFADPGGSNLVISQNAGALTLWDRTADGTSYRNHASFVYGDSGVYPWRLTTSPHGGSCLTPWGNAGSSDYTLLSLSGSTYLNASSGGTLYFRIGNSSVGQSTASTWTIFPTLSCNAISCGTISSTTINSNGYGITAGGGTLTGGACNVGGGQVSCGTLAASSQSNSPQHWSDANPGGAWYQAQIVAYNSPGGQSGARLAMYGSAGAQWRVNYELGSTIAAMDVNNGATVSVMAASFPVGSALATKKDVRSLRPERERIFVHRDPASDVVEQPDIMALRPVAFRPRILMQLDGEDYPADTPLGRETRRERIGLIADEVQHVIPSAAVHDFNDDVVGIDYAQVTVALLDHVQRLTDEVATLRYRVAELEGTQT